MGRVGLVRTLKGVIVFLALMAAVCYGALFPDVIEEMGREYAYLSWLAGPGKAAVWVSALPIAIALVLFWRICTDIGRDNSFCQANARRLSGIGFCALVDTAYCAVGTVTLCFLVKPHPSIWLAGLGASVAGLGIALAAFLLSHLVLKAAALKEDSDLTI